MATVSPKLFRLIAMSAIVLSSLLVSGYIHTHIDDSMPVHRIPDISSKETNEDLASLYPLMARSKPAIGLTSPKEDSLNIITTRTRTTEAATSSDIKIEGMVIVSAIFDNGAVINGRFCPIGCLIPLFIQRPTIESLKSTGNRGRREGAAPSNSAVLSAPVSSMAEVRLESVEKAVVVVSYKDKKYTVPIFKK